MKKNQTVKHLKLYACAFALVFSTTLTACSPKEEYENEPITTEETPQQEPIAEEQPEVQDSDVPESLDEKYLNLPIYTDADRAAYQDMKESFMDAFSTSFDVDKMNEMKEDMAYKLEYFKRFLQNDENATYGGYTFGELSDKMKEEMKGMYHKIDTYLSTHIDSYDEIKEKAKQGFQKVIERGKNGWKRFRDNEWQDIKNWTNDKLDKYFPEEYE